MVEHFKGKLGAGG
jgi:glutamate dehydrogenase